MMIHTIITRLLQEGRGQRVIRGLLGLLGLPLETRVGPKRAVKGVSTYPLGLLGLVGY